MRNRAFAWLFAGLLATGLVHAETTIHAYIGPGNGDNGLATQALFFATSLREDTQGNLYLISGNQVRKIDRNGIITTVAGSMSRLGTSTGDGGPAINATLNRPAGLAISAAGEIYVAEGEGRRIRKIDRHGIITTIAGNGQDGFAGDGVPALGSPMGILGGISFDDEGNLLVAAKGQRRIRKISPGGLIGTVAGTGEVGFFDAPGPALGLPLSDPVNVEAGRSGEFYLIEGLRRRLYKVDRDGVISLVGPPEQANGPNTFWFSTPRGLSMDPQGRLLVTDEGRGIIWRIDAEGVPTRVAGSDGSGGGPNRGDGGPALTASISYPAVVVGRADGSFLFGERHRSELRRVDIGGTIDYFAGGGRGDGAPLADVVLNRVSSLALSPGGDLYLGEGGFIRRLPRGANATTTPLGPFRYQDTIVVGQPYGLAVDSRGRIFYEDGGQGPVQMIDENGLRDSIPGRHRAWMSRLMIDDAGRLVMSPGHEMQRVDLDTGIATTIAGARQSGFSGDGGPATSARFYNISSFVLDPNGGMVLVDHGNARIRRIWPDGIVTTIAGNGVRQASGETGPATALPVDNVNAIVLSPDDRIFFIDGLRVREISTDGIVRTVAGTGQSGHQGDGGPAINASFTRPSAMVMDRDGSLLIGDEGRVRRVILDDPPSPPPPPLRMSIADRSTIEGDSGHSTVQFTVSLSQSAASPVRFSVRAQPGSAVEGSDYLAPPGHERTIPVGQATATIEVQIVGDLVEESTETFQLVLESVSGAQVARGTATGTIKDNDEATPPPVGTNHPVARPDRRVVGMGDGPVILNVLANDDIDPAARQGMSLQLAIAPPQGHAEAVEQGFRYTPAAGVHGDVEFSYRLCDGQGRCDVAEVVVELRPIPYFGRVVDTRTGNVAIALSGLPDISAATFRTTPLVRSSGFVLEAGPDPSPRTPWDSTQGNAFQLLTLSRRGEGMAHWVRVEGFLTPGVDPAALYVGQDSNGDGLPQAEEVMCVEAGSEQQACDLRFVESEAGDTKFWILLNNRGPSTREEFVRVFDVPVMESNGALVATGPGRVPEDESFEMLLSWDSQAMNPSAIRLGYVEMDAGPGRPLGMFPVRLQRNGGQEEPVLLSPVQSAALYLQPGEELRGVFLDVPEGSSRLEVRSVTASPGVQVRLVPSGIDLDPEQSTVPEVALELLAQSAPAIGSAVQVVESPRPGRWYVVPSNPSSDMAHVTLFVDVEGAAPPVRPGSYFNASRPGHGLFLYPAGDQWAGLWYTYDRNSQGTWYYLQGPAPGMNGIWDAGIYRSAWYGASNKLTRVGGATLATIGADAFTFSYTLDGLTGSEPMASLGRGCPRLGGVPLDVSSHWFDPARAGTGFSVQMWEDYEYLAAFIYDARGEPRFLAAERSGFAGADAILPLQQLNGSCPTCAFLPASRSDIGTLRRRIAGGALDRIELDVEFTGAVPGLWSSVDQVQLLGGPGSTQGCAP